MLNACHPKKPQTDQGNASVSCDSSNVCVSRCAACGRVCPCDSRAASLAAQTKMQAMIAESKIFEGQPQFQTVAGSDICVAEHLGEGGYSMVDACTIDSFQDCRLAIKYLKPDVMLRQKYFEHGAADLVAEAFFLARLSHPNIVKLRAVPEITESSNSYVATGKDAGFFIVIDRLDELLEQRMASWRHQVQKMPSGVFYKRSRQYKETQRTMLHERLQVAWDLANVMEYLHSQNIVFRDLKPDNVGFDIVSIPPYSIHVYRFL